MNSGAQFKWATSRQDHIARSRRGLRIDCNVWNARAKGRSWKASRHRLRL